MVAMECNLKQTRAPDRDRDLPADPSTRDQARLHPHDHEDTPPGDVSKDKITVANVSGARLKTSSPSPSLWSNKMRLERAREQYMQSVQRPQPTSDDDIDDDDDDDEDDEEEDEGAVEEDEEQFNALDDSIGM